jgi:anti-anti-sigma regulatory factor
VVTPHSVDALRPGDHACLTFSDPDERLDIVAAFVQAGLDQGHKVLCLTESVPPELFPRELQTREVSALEAIRRGQLSVQGNDRSWLAGGEASAQQMMDLLGRQLDQAAQEGYPVLRMTADMCWASRPVAGTDQLLAFESGVESLFADGRLAAICQYDREAFDPVTLAFAASSHPLSVTATAYHEDPILRICRQHSPPGIRMAGEIDFTGADPLTQAVLEAIRLDKDIHINLAQLRYIDAACASIIIQAAATLPPDRCVTVVCRGLVHEMFALLGAGDAGSLRVLMAHGQP